MRWLIDEMLPPATAELLNERGHDAVSVYDVGLTGAADPDVFDHEGAVSVYANPAPICLRSNLDCIDTDGRHATRTNLDAPPSRSSIKGDESRARIMMLRCEDVQDANHLDD